MTYQLDRQSEVPIPEQIATAIEEMIRARAWRIGERIPSIRASAKSFGVSATTVAQAYTFLEAKGAIEAKPRSGYYVRRWNDPVDLVPGPSRSMLPLEPHQVRPLRMLGHMEQARARADMVELGNALPTESLLPHEELARAMGRVLRRSTRRFVAIEGPQGAIDLRRELSRNLLELGLAVTPDELFVTTGATEALHLALRAVARKGDVIALESPAYYGFFQSLGVFEMRTLELPCDARDGMDTDALEEALVRGVPVRAVLTCPAVSNPLGATLTMERGKHLVNLAREYDFTIIEDMTYSDLCFDEQGRRALDTQQEDVRIIRYGSFSKSLAPGFRLGWCVPGEYESRFRAAKVTTTMSTPTITQLAAAEFMRQGTYARCVEELRGVFEVKTTWLREHIAQTFPEGTRLSNPAGGHVLWLELPGGINTSELFERCVQQGVSFAPGELFSNSDAFRSCLRINVALDWDERNLDALAVIETESKAMLATSSKRLANS